MENNQGNEPGNAEPQNQGEPQQPEPAEDWQSKFEEQRKVNRDLESKLDQARKRLDHMDDVEKQLAVLQGKEAEYEKAKQVEDINRQAVANANRRVLKAEVRAAASGRLNDPGDALRYLDLDKFEVGEDGEVDSTAIGAAIDQLLETKPYLGKAENTPQGVRTTPPSGTRDGDNHQGQLTRDDLKRMTPQQIVEAQNKGRLNDLLGVKNK